MKEIVFNDGRNLEIQSVESREGKLYVRVILTTSEQLKALFGDEFATRKMTLYENHKEQEAFENYNKRKVICKGYPYNFRAVKGFVWG